MSAKTRAESAKPGKNGPGLYPDSLLRMAEEIFELTKLGWLLRAKRRKRGTLDLTESEFLTLDLLVQNQSLTVSQLRKRIGVLPAQMSRILRSLERRTGKPLIRCTINPQDRRKVNVSITEAGKRAHRAFREARLATTLETLLQLPDPDRREFMRLLEKIRALIAPKVAEENEQ